MNNPCWFRKVIDHTSQLNVRRGEFAAPIQGIYEIGLTGIGTNTLLQGQGLGFWVEKNGGIIDFGCGTYDTQDLGAEQYHCSGLIRLEANDKIRIKVAAGTIHYAYFQGKYVRPF